MENYYRILTEIKNAVSRKDLNAFKISSALLNYVNSSEKCEMISNYQKNTYEKLGDTNLICLACKSSADKVLKYLFTSENFLYNLPYMVQKSSLLPEDKDEEGHNAFYYAIRSNVCNLVDILIEKWPNNIFKENSDRLDNILSEAYKDLLVRRVCISKDMELYIKNKLMDLRFYDVTPAKSKQKLSAPIDIKHLRNLTMLRIEFVLESIDLVKKQFRETEPDELILLSLKYIAKNIYMLKSALASNSKVPWEEIEFCLVIFIRSLSNRFEKDPLYHFVLNKKRIAAHLENFSNILIAIKGKLKTANVNKWGKLKITIDKKISYFNELYNDFILLRDLYSLETIKHSIDLAMSADVTQKDGQLLITRALQVIGEHLKNTKGSPKLSDATNEILLSALPPDLKKIVIVTELRDYLSHAESLCRRSEIEESGQHFYTSIQSDINQMNLAVNEIFLAKKAAIIGMTVSKLIDCKDFCSRKLYIEENFILPFVLKKELEEVEKFNMGNVEQLEKLVADLQRESEREFSQAKNLYRRIHDIIRENDQSASSATDEITQICEDFVSYHKSLHIESDNLSVVQGLSDEIYPTPLLQTTSKIYDFLQLKWDTKRLEIVKKALITMNLFSESPKIVQLFLELKKLEERHKINKENVEVCERLISDRENSIDGSASCRSKIIQIIFSVIQEEKHRLKTIQNNYRNTLQEFVSIISDSEGLIGTSVNQNMLQIYSSSLNIERFFKKIILLILRFLKQLSEEMFPKGTRFTVALNNLYFYCGSRMGKIKWIKEFQQILKCSKKSQLPKSDGEICEFNAGLKNQLSMKIKSLRYILNDYHLEDASSEKVQLYEKNSKLRSVIEMLVLDVTECLTGRLNHNAFFLDDDYPVINGKNFRNHLAHGNALIDILLDDDFTNVILNASKMVKGDLLQSKRCIGKKIKNNPLKSKSSHLKDSKTVKEQLALFAALSAGNIEEVKDCRRKGADLKGRSLDLSTALHFAAKSPNKDMVKFVIEFNPDVNVTDTSFQTPLHIASAHGRLDTVQYLVKEMKMETNFRDRDGKTALHHASQKGHLPIVEFLLKHKAVKTFRDISGYAPVHYAVENNHIDIVTILLEKEPNVEANQTFSRLSALHIAAKNGHLNLVETLIQRKDNASFISDVQFATLHFAIIGGHVEVVKYLIAKGADVNAKNRNGLTCLQLAVVKGRHEIVAILLTHGADVNAFYLQIWTPLSIAAKRGDLQIVKLLLKDGADVNVFTESDHTPLALAARFGHYEIVKTLLGECNINNKIKALLTAAYNGYKRIVELIVNDGVDVNATCRFGKKITALHCAALAGHHDIVNFLIAKGCNINAKSEYKDEVENFTSYKQIFADLFLACKGEVPDVTGFSKYLTLSESILGQTALHLSCRAGHRDVVQSLLKSKADTLIKDYADFTPLQCIVLKGMADILIEEEVPVSICDWNEFPLLRLGAENGDLNFVKYCIKDGCDINIRSEIFALTPLHSAIVGGHKEMVEFLLDNGADINARTKFDQSVFDTAVFYNRKEVLSILIKRNFGISAEIERKLLLGAIKKGCEDIVEYFLSRNPNNGLANAECNEYPLHVAVEQCHRNILEMLLEEGKGFGINDCNGTGITPLVSALKLGYSEITQLLLSKGADSNIPSSDGVLPLHLAIWKGSTEMVKLLIKAKANASLRDFSCNSAIELAIMSQNLAILETLLDNSAVHINFRGEEGRDLFRKAVTAGHLETVKYLVERGVDINVVERDSQGDTPMHVAAMSGHQHIVEYFLSLGLNIQNRIKQSNLVHYAAIGNQSEICEFLYRKGLDFNVSDGNDCTPLSLAIRNNNIEVFHALLHFGAYYEENYIRNEIKSDNLSLDHFFMTISLTLISELFLAIRKNNISLTEALLSTSLTFSKFGYANVRNSKNISLIHFAVLKGHEYIVDVLLERKANPNAVKKVTSRGETIKGGSPLHYAAKFSHSRIVKSLLSHGAAFDAVCDSGKTPLDYATDSEIFGILNCLRIIFTKIQNGETVFNILSVIEDMQTRKAVVRAKNINGKTLTALSVARNHPEAELLKTVFQTNTSASLQYAEYLFKSGQLEESIKLLHFILEKRIELFGPDDFEVLKIQLHLAEVFARQNNLTEALNLAESVYKNRKEILGECHSDTLIAKRDIANFLGSQGHNKQALNMCEEVLNEQIKTFGLNHNETFKTQIMLVQFMRECGKLEAALVLSEKMRKEISYGSEETIFSLELKQDIAKELSRLGKHSDALEILQCIYERQKDVFGQLHPATIETLDDIAVVYTKMNNLEDALKTFKRVLVFRFSISGPNDIRILNTQLKIAHILALQCTFDEALEIYERNLEKRIALFGTDDPVIQETKEKIDFIVSHLVHQVMPPSLFFNTYPVLSAQVLKSA